MRLVVDASVALKWFMTERPDEQNVAEAALVGKSIETSRAELFAPPHWIAEIISVLARLDPPAVDGALTTLGSLEYVTICDQLAMRRAADLWAQAAAWVIGLAAGFGLALGMLTVLETLALRGWGQVRSMSRA